MKTPTAAVISNRHNVINYNRVDKGNLSRALGPGVDTTPPRPAPLQSSGDARFFVFFFIDITQFILLSTKRKHNVLSTPLNEARGGAES